MRSPIQKIITLNLLIILVLLFGSNIPIESIDARITAERTKDFTCSADTYVSSANSDSNYGETDLLLVNSSGKIQRIFLEFEVIGLPSDAVISNVELEISVKTLPDDGHTVKLEIRETTSFEELDLSWNNQPTLNLEIVGKADIAENKRMSIPLSEENTSTLTKHNLKGNGLVYYCLTTSIENNDEIVFDSRDDLFNPPKLEITYQSSDTIQNGDEQPILTIGPVNIYLGGLIVMILAGGLVAAFLYGYKNRKR